MRKRLLRLTVAVLCVAGLLPSQAQTYDKEPATVAWDFNTQADYDKVTTLKLLQLCILLKFRI